MDTTVFPQSCVSQLSRAGAGEARFFNIVIVFVAAEKYEIPRRLVALDAEGYHNP
jgi:hypothetical protein